MSGGVPLLVGVLLVALSGLPALLLPRGARLGDRLCNGLLVLGAALGCLGAGLTLAQGETAGWLWQGRAGPMGFRVDALSAMFLLQTFVIAAAGSVYGLAYWPAPAHPDTATRLRLFYGTTTAGLALVFSAADALTFLVGWELMALSAFVALTTEDRDVGVRQAGLLYLFCTRAGTLCLIAMFLVLQALSGTFLLDPVAGASTGVFALALLGFGFKAGVMPLHVWLPGAHASAPSHVSALMSGVLIKAGIYGLIRVLGLFSAPPLWWAEAIFTLGAVSSVLGVVFAIGQHDIKRLLAYHSIENIGIILLGLGLALAGRALDLPVIAALGLGGALLHTWNHGLFKSLLFLSAGSVIHETGLRQIDQMGGLSRRMPGSAMAFLVGAVAICGLPPLNGFVSEFLIYAGLLGTLPAPGGRLWLMGALGAPALAITGALAALCFAKVYGVAFLGEPRSAAAASAHPAPRLMVAPMGALAALCGFIGLGSLAVAPVLDAAVSAWMGPGRPLLAELVPLRAVTMVAVLLLVLIAGTGWGLRRRLASAPSQTGPTWDCGYATPTARMQYTASSFAETVVALFSWALFPKAVGAVGAAPFPPRVHRHAVVRDAATDLVLLPAARGLARGMGALHRLQRGSLQSALLYLLLAIIVAFSLS